MPVFHEEAGPERPKLDEWGHLHTRVFDLEKGVAGVLENIGTVRHASHHGEQVECMGRLVYARGNPVDGYDRVWWYRTVADARVAMERWEYPNPPPGFIRDMHREPISSLEEDD